SPMASRTGVGAPQGAEGAAGVAFLVRPGRSRRSDPPHRVKRVAHAAAGERAAGRRRPETLEGPDRIGRTEHEGHRAGDGPRAGTPEKADGAEGAGPAGDGCDPR